MSERMTDPNLVGKEKPASCRMRLQAEGKPYPRSGCDSCHMGGMLGCPYDKQRPDASHQFERPSRRREGPEDISSMSYADKQAAMRLWKSFGGDHHGPNVETVTMPMNAFWSFLEAYAADARKDYIGTDEKGRKIMTGYDQADVVDSREQSR